MQHDAFARKQRDHALGHRSLRVDLICHAEQVAHVALGCGGKFHAIFHGNGRGTEGEFHVKHFLYSRNGCGTDGHPRVPEDEQMAAELTAYLESFGPDLWQ